MPLMAADWGESQVPLDKAALMWVRLQMNRWLFGLAGKPTSPEKAIRDGKWGAL